MNIIIIEDSDQAVDRLKKMLSIIDETIKVVGICDSIEMSVKWLKNNPPPELILMDIELSDGRCFEIFDQVKITSSVIFTTAYNEFAIKAIKLNAMDYLLKPIDKTELTQAIQKVKATLATVQKAAPDYSIVKQSSVSIFKGQKPKKLAISDLNSTRFVDIENILRFEADSNYTKIFLLNKEKITTSRTLKEYNELLSDYGFIRIHSAHLINLSMVDKYIKGDGGIVIMKDGENIEVSRQKKKDLLDALSFN